MISLELNKPTRLDANLFERWEREYIATHTFDEMWDDAEPTLQKGCRYNRIGNLWLELENLVPRTGSYRALTGIETHPTKTLVRGQPKFVADRAEDSRRGDDR